eukprot:TRINITY_DN20018_c0_g1_i1.p1 TRINITY_DN20018_c0_g1~~TRINITY_DN20018_c0_g1_i1.p1  ORF type:complete len:548 (-),score=121.28 TRINITY_DN20018_c0_g1_i1:171-1814(-)
MLAEQPSMDYTSPARPPRAAGWESTCSAGAGTEDEVASGTGGSSVAQKTARTKRSASKQGESLAEPESGQRSRKQHRSAQEVNSEDAEDENCTSKDVEIKRLQQELSDQRALASRARSTLQASLVQIARTEREKRRELIFREEQRLGRVRRDRSVFEQEGYPGWEGGSEAQAIEEAKNKLHQFRQELESLRRKIPKQSKTRTMDADDFESGFNAQDADITCTHQEAYLRREEAALKEREQRLSLDRSVHLKQQQLREAEDKSPFRNYRMIENRFQLLNMLGMGGFCRVFKAFDLETMSFCALKIHHVEHTLNDVTRECLVRWAMREYTTQQALKHPGIVLVHAKFPLDHQTLVGVFELCEGDTLDVRLKLNGALKEQEAKAIIVQILHALRYLNSDGRAVIHYDIKPSNIFYNKGQVKIGDFGLCKTADHSPEGMLDLTTKGVGTSWYLPPECHETGVPKINGKVDVWSVGVVFYELLFNRRPFGHGQTQDAFTSSTASEGAFDLVIPSSPKVSTEAKDFLGKLLTKDRDQRPDVFQALADTYLKKR